MKADSFRILKIILYAVSLAEIMVFSRLAEKNGKNIEMAIITLVLLAVNFAAYKITVKMRDKKKVNDDGH